MNRRFCGPPDSVNGGYMCGRVAAYVGGPATVRLTAPPPLETPLSVRDCDDGIEVLHGERRVAIARPGLTELDVPPAPSFDAATAAAHDYHGFRQHSYPTCFVCGPKREYPDGLNIFAGPLPGGDAVAAPWTPDESLARDDGAVDPVYHWAALDCPGAFAFLGQTGNPILLGELTAEIHRLARPGEPLAVVGWEIASEGRRHVTGTAIYAPGGQCIARARGIWFELRE